MGDQYLNFGFFYKQVCKELCTSSVQLIFLPMKYLRSKIRATETVIFSSRIWCIFAIAVIKWSHISF